MQDISLLDDYLQRLGYDTTAKKSFFQQNEEMASVLVTFLMSELDVLNKRITELEAEMNAK
ncbi:hypothetical protein [Bacillus thermotolerans]|uniref:Uncharacterized protein n=1 Tax=Bacillus thermotolerans TaxID=1221996 RepID=A0A0F5HMX8_BACTR|nr:hypothetical protein [Bacillus thermotolerans]KKB34651.1 hypothetical protein QY97_02201 [Bacillus thermotolerans]KKB38575.1 hypothetical protein QY95_02573 [Bacillus thermotolerans]